MNRAGDGRGVRIGVGSIGVGTTPIPSAETAPLHAPREVARTKEGRERIAMMIRSLPAVGGPGGLSIEPPREEMLREIGVEGP